ncbi:pimeloyl-ACP methyl ester carboxylesterase [Brevibacterium sanguinis]|uniref:Pimeloyl-ACP methyl ester carboxylesterase n=2 Tax=Brevibacterium TaxID=1696 RepID=A0A366IN89_9MICO|nr:MULTISPECIES: alpha/beta hydrolase [Brevibacterium]RBP68045.1 pimeloyl-ACP methyl ester carboxylesterase [Brevibacterium sanguinis]RBP74538.1 pimeloyl-ACP methyl ester carboxylesterase [Brevibacterium celere]
MTAQEQLSPAVVLLHGVGLDRTVWARVEALLDREVVALDLPGHGRQPRLTRTTSLTEMAEDVIARLPAGPVHLVGFSLGSLIAQQIAADLPGRVRSLGCVSSVCARTEAETAAVRSRLEKARANFGESMEIALDRWFPDDDEGRTQGRRAAESAAALRDETRPVLLANDIDSYLFAYAVFAQGDREIEPRLREIAVPTLAITGELDPGSTPEMSRRLGERIPQSRVVIVDGARHMLPVTHPETLTHHLDNLFDEAERRQS